MRKIAQKQKRKKVDFLKSFEGQSCEMVYKGKATTNQKVDKIGATIRT